MTGQEGPGKRESEGPDIQALESLSAGLIGLEQPCRSIGAFLVDGNLPSLLLAGPEGIGKRTIALRLAQAANCAALDVSRPCRKCPSCRSIAKLNHPDVRLLFPFRRRLKNTDRNDGESSAIENAMATIDELTPDYLPERPAPPLEPDLNIPIAVVRWLRIEMARPPFAAAHRFIIVLHAERMTLEAANAFLKTLEEPQRQTTFIITSSSPSLLLDTIRSRCRLVRFPAVPAALIRAWLEDRTPGTAASLAAEISDGSPGRALRFLEDPDDFLDPAVIEFFTRPQLGDRQVFDALTRLGDVSPTTIVSSFLFLLDQTLRRKHELPTCYAADNPDLERRACSLPDDYLRRAIRYLIERLGETRLNINRRLFLYTLLASLRRSA